MLSVTLGSVRLRAAPHRATRRGRARSVALSETPPETCLTGDLRSNSPEGVTGESSWELAARRRQVGNTGVTSVPGLGNYPSSGGETYLWISALLSIPGCW